MKNRKLVAALLAAALTLSLAACGGNAVSGSSEPAPSATPSSSAAPEGSAPSAAGEPVKIGILQLMEHDALDAAYQGFVDGLAEAGYKDGEQIKIDFQNAQGEQANCQTIADKFVSDKVDLVLAIATPAAQGAAAAAENSGIPVVFSAVTDPVAAGLVASIEAPGGSITGTSDAIPVEKMFSLAQELTPDVKSYGLIYNTSEDNSLSVIAQVKDYLEGKGIPYTEGAVTTSADVQSSARNLLERCDAVFAPIDNTVASAMAVLADEAIQAKKPVYVAADSLVAYGGDAAVGVNYTNLGSQTADMVLKIVTGTPVSQVPVEVLRDNNLVINGDTARAIGVDISQYGPNDATFVSSVA